MSSDITNTEEMMAGRRSYPITDGGVERRLKKLLKKYVCKISISWQKEIDQPKEEIEQR